MNEEIKNPNQLDLFEGILLSPEQEKQVMGFVERQKNTAEFRIKAVKQVESQLLAAGFIKDNHFINDFKVETITTDVTLGYSYNNTQFTVELTYLDSTGDIKLKGTYLSLDKKQIEERTFYFNEHKGKFNCYGLQDNNRYVKAETLLQKLIENDERVVRAFRENQKKTDLKQSVIEKYTKLYPNATIEVKNDWTKYSGSFDVIEVRFESGSYVQFRIDGWKNEEYLYKKHDATFEKLSSDELLERFSKQVKKEALN
jgi:hypothetical protein